VIPLVKLILILSVIFLFSVSRKSSKCNELLLQINDVVYWKGHINPYNILKDCYNSSANDYKLQSPHLTNDPYMIMKILTAKYLGQNISDSDVSILSAVTPSCIDDRFARYLNNNTVRRAIHIKPNSPEWGICSTGIGYKPQLADLKPQFLELIERKLNPIIIYSGDIDFVCNFESSEWFVDSLNLPVVKKFQKWTVGDQTAGFVKRFEHGVSFVTVKGAGHMVPEDKPTQMIEIVKELIGQSKLV